jgi:N-acetyltransferase
MTVSSVFEKVVLEGDHVRLEPLAISHKPGLEAAICDGELWKLFVTLVPHPQQLEGFFAQASEWHEAGDGLAFATIDKRTGKVAGSTRFMKTNLPHKRVEIGFTFLGESWQRTPINTEAKLLMLQYAFETLQLNRVELITDYFNNRSRAAILRLGAKEEGILRSHMVMPNGRVRDSVLFSIVSHEWRGVKENLLCKLNRAPETTNPT